jgi:hypothetical protein
MWSQADFIAATAYMVRDLWEGVSIGVPQLEPDAGLVQLLLGHATPPRVDDPA